MLERSHPITPIMAILGGAAFIAATVQYAVAQAVVAAAWNPAYNWGTNVISDLGNTACGQFAVHGSTSYVCSPRHAVMNASFVTSGVLLFIGMLLLWRLWTTRRMTTVALVLWFVACLGKVVVGLVPENTNVSLHTLGAVNLPISSIAILLLSLVMLRGQRTLAVTGLVISIVSLVASVLWSAAQGAGSALNLGLGTGGMERLASYPSNVWFVVVGLFAIMVTRDQMEGARRLPSGMDILGAAGR